MKDINENKEGKVNTFSSNDKVQRNNEVSIQMVISLFMEIIKDFSELKDLEEKINKLNEQRSTFENKADDLYEKSEKLKTKIEEIESVSSFVKLKFPDLEKNTVCLNQTFNCEYSYCNAELNLQVKEIYSFLKKENEIQSKINEINKRIEENFKKAENFFNKFQAKEKFFNEFCLFQMKILEEKYGKYL